MKLKHACRHYKAFPKTLSLLGEKTNRRDLSAQPPTEKVFPSSSSFISPSQSWWCIISNLNFNYCCIIRRNLTTTCTFMFSHFSVIIIPITFKSCKWVQSAVHTSDNRHSHGERRSTNFIKIYSISSCVACVRAGTDRFSDFKLIRRTSRKSLRIYVSNPISLSVCANNAIWVNVHALDGRK